MTEITKERRDATWGSRPTPTEAAAHLRAYANKMRLRVPPNDNIFTDAATVIDRLLDALDAAEAKMWAAKPAEWQRRGRYELNGPGSKGVWEPCSTLEATDPFERNPRCEYRPLYAAPPAAEPVIPDGWVLVPREPTNFMAEKGVEAGAASGEHEWSYSTFLATIGDGVAISMYRAMLAAAPALVSEKEAE